MKKNEFLAMSLPYGLHCSFLYDNEDIQGSIIVGIEFTVDGEFSSEKPLCFIDEFGEYRSDIIKPILHPLSDLTKEIEHRGEKFVPIVELAKINDKWLKSTDVYSVECRNSDVYRDGKSEMRYECKSFQKTTNMGALSIVFGYDDRLSRFYKYDETRKATHAVAYQLQLFQKLIEWHFDIAGLIESGEAIDVNTLTENPYK